MSQQLSPADVEILAAALISDRPEIMQLGRLAPDHQAAIAEGRRQGLHLVSVRWMTGEFALMFCEPGSDYPSPENIIRAFHACRRTTAIFPSGVAP